jgi:hypothetical protein
MFSDIVTQKSEAKRDIQGALLGLLVVMAAVVVLTIINPDLTTFDPEIERIDRAELPPSNDGSDVEATGLLAYCAEQEGNCDVRNCNALGLASWEYVVAGAAVGSVIPGIGTVTGAVAGAAAWGTRIAGNAAECAAVCTWLDGETFETNGQNSCRFPNDSFAAQAAILEEIRQDLKEQYDCQDGRLIMLGGEFSNCIRDIAPETQDEIITNLGVPLSVDAENEVINQMKNFAIQDVIVSDQTIIDSLTDELGATTNVLVVEIPTNILSPRRLELEPAVEGVCRTIANDTNQDLSIAVVDRDGSSYIVCGQ